MASTHHSSVVMLVLLILFAVIHSGGAALRSRAELEDLVKQEHARIDSQDKEEKASESKGAAAKASSSVAPEPKKEE